MVAAALSTLCFFPAALIHNLQDHSISSGLSFVPSNRPFAWQHSHPSAHRSGRRHALSPLSAAGADILPTVREGVTEAGGIEEWEKSISILSATVDVDSEEAETMLAQALSWRGWAIVSEKMRRFQRPISPDAAKLEDAIAWLRDGPLQLDQSQLVAAIKSSPKVYLVEPAVTYKKAVGSAPREYRDADVFKAMVLNDPSVMECTYNCDGEGCASECGNCWVSYAMRS
mmetsp:Transcript_21828/g.48840  ORF Transcript_21828/g.48840 Transcript_21828/m.48840 type:complete len:228 (-) Transcript_21828:196-879(-)